MNYVHSSDIPVIRVGLSREGKKIYHVQLPEGVTIGEFTQPHWAEIFRRAVEDGLREGRSH